MSWQKLRPSLEFRTITLCPAVIFFFVLLPHLPLYSYPEVQVSVKFPPTVNRGSIPKTSGGGTRRGLSSCTQQDKTPLTALMPSNNTGTTAAANPTFFWYVPRTNAKSAKAEFLLVDERENEVYQANFALTGASGIINLSLPANTSLKVGKTYRWQFTIICDPDNPNSEQFEFVEGAVKRTELNPNLQAKIVEAAPLERATLYANAGIWHETLTILAQMRNSRPTEWEELLKSVGLIDPVTKAPFVK